MTPAPRKPSPSSPATDHPPARPAAAGNPRPASARPPARLTSPAIAARVRQLAAQAEHRRAIAEFHARRAADQQTRTDALLLETIAALASLFSQPGRTGNHPARPSRSGTARRPAAQHRHHQDLP